MACSVRPAFEDANATLELYPNSMMRALGMCFGRKLASCNHTFPLLAVQVDRALDPVLSGFKPWTATILIMNVNERSHRTLCAFLLKTVCKIWFNAGDF
jgi:hypothetical protein